MREGNVESRSCRQSRPQVIARACQSDGSSLMAMHGVHVCRTEAYNCNKVTPTRRQWWQLAITATATATAFPFCCRWEEIQCRIIYIRWESICEQRAYDDEREKQKKKTLLLYTQHAWHQEEKNKCITDGKVIITLKYHFLSSSLYNFILARTFYVWLGEREVARPACTHLRCTMDAVRIRVRLHSTIMLTVGTIYAANSCRVTQTKTTRKKLISRVHIWKMFLDGRMAIDAHMDANACTHTSVHVAYNMHVSHEYAHDRYDYGIDVRVRFDKCNNRDKK